MKSKKGGWLPFRVVMVASIVLGTLLGSTLALANDSVMKNLYGGWNYSDGTFDELPEWKFSTASWIWLEYDKSEAFCDDLRLFNGQVPSGLQTIRRYGPVVVADDQASPYGDAWTYYNFYYFPIQGTDLYYAGIDWTMGELSQGHSVWVQPWVYDFPFGDPSPQGIMNLISVIQ